MIDILYDLQQGTEEWLNFRKTRISATDAYDLLRGRSIEEILSSKQNSHFKGNYYTKRGHLLEDEAKIIYSEAFEPLTNAGAILNSKFPNAMCSPDGIAGDKGLVEVKCFNPERHLKVYHSLDPHILAQIQFQLLISEREWCDLTLYNPDMPDINDTFLIKHILPDPSIQEKLISLLTL